MNSSPRQTAAGHAGHRGGDQHRRGALSGQRRASKHLRVLREVGLVRVREQGKQRLYALDATGLKPIHAWTSGFERFWNATFYRLDDYLKKLAREEKARERRK